MQIERVVSLILGLILTGETIALCVGAWFSKSDSHPWKCPCHGALLVSDMLIGLVCILFASAIMSNPKHEYLILVIVCGCGLITHLFRDIQYLVRANNQFCFNTSLFIVNNIKLVGIIWLLGYMVSRGIP